MASYQKPDIDFRTCSLCGTVTKVIYARPFHDGSIMRNRRCPSCTNSLKTYEVTQEDYLKLHPNSKPMKQIQSPRKESYKPKFRKNGKPVVPKPKPVELPPDFKVNDYALNLIRQLDQRNDTSKI